MRRTYLRITNKTNSFFVSIINEALTSGLMYYLVNVASPSI